MRSIACLVLALCLAAPAALADPGPKVPDSFLVEIEGGTLTVHHVGALYNCCPEPFVYNVSLDGDLIRIREEEVLEYPCVCLCTFNLDVVVEDVQPGNWTIVFQWFDYETRLWQEQELPIVVPDAGQSGILHVASVEDSGCLSIGSRTESWGAIKRRYQ